MTAPRPAVDPTEPTVPAPELPTDPLVRWLEDHLHQIPELPSLLLAAVTGHGPALAVAVLVVVALVASGQQLLGRWRHRHHARGARVVEVAVPATVEADSAAAWWKHQAGLYAPWWKRLVYGQPHLGFEYVADQGGIRFQIWVPGSVPAGHVEKAVQAAWPGAILTTRPAGPLLTDEVAAAGGRLVLGNTDHHPLAHDHDSDPLRPLLAALSGLRQGEHAAVQILARPVTGRRLRRAHRAAAHLRGARSTAPQAALFDLATPEVSEQIRFGELARRFPERAGQVRAILAKAAQPRFAVQISYLAATTRHPSDRQQARPWLRARAHQIATAFALYASAHQHLRRQRLHSPGSRLAGRRLRRGFLLGVDELAALAHLPLDLDAPGVTRAGARPVAPSPAVPSTGTRDRPVRVLGDADAGQPRPVALAVAGARQHLHVLGQTGVGKSTFLAGQILADAHAGRGALVIDPKGDLIADLLDRLPERAVGKTVVFDPAQGGLPPCVNVLAGPDPAFAAEAIVTTFRRCFSSAWGPRMDDLMRSACLTLVKADGANASLAKVPKLLTDDAYRARQMNKLGDELLRGFWKDYNELSPGGRAALTGPVMNKLRAVLLRPFVHAALSGGASTVDLGRVLDGGGLVLVRAAKGMLGEDAARLFGSLLLAQTWQAITPRANLPEESRRDAAAYVDEAHNFLNLPGSISDILAEARAYRFSMVIAHQHLSQLPKDLRDAVSADARNKIYFAISPEDAHALNQHTAPQISKHDLVHLGAFQAAARTINGPTPTAPFTFRTRPLPEPVPGRAEAIRDASHQHYSPKRAVSARKTNQSEALTDKRRALGGGLS
ncbi:hypothetical protein ACFVH6_23655 [Spirillospora sp. NPDC127200]